MASCSWPVRRNVVAWRANETATERRTRGARDRAEDAQLRLAALVESTDDAVIGKTPDGTVTSWNAGAERLFGRTAEKMAGASVLAIVPEDHRDEERELMVKVVEEGRPDHFETTRLHADGGTIDVSLTLSRVRDVGAGDLGSSPSPATSRTASASSAGGKPRRPRCRGSRTPTT